MVKKFQGNWCVFLFLLLFGIFPGVIYYLIQFQEITPKIAPQPQVIYIQQPTAPQPTVQQKKFCSACGAVVTGKFCNNCGVEFK